ncbi:putative nuclear RNA export factor SDE5 isoform X2 [Euphorbia lathyris]|uniref:putative nuclear RNA export factor SDE5 isoform X2 n=1 Tax=Euphorbia lathyris TaxID=212925 RepID=UPI003313478D
MSLRYDDNNEKALKGLIGAFGSTFSLQDITSAYHKADKKADLAGEILFEMEGRGSTSSKFASHRKPIILESSRSYDNVFDKSRRPNGKARARKQIWRPISRGTVSSVLGKDYVKPVSIAYGCTRTKPTKLDAKELPASVIWGEETGLDPSNNGQLQKETEDFVFRMLGGGFPLEEHLIQQIIDNCGYDVQKSMDKLLDMPAPNMDEGDKRLSKSMEKTLEVHSNYEHPSLQNSFPPMSSNGGGANGISNLNGDGVTQQEKRNDLQKEVLVALFNVADESKVSRRKERPKRRSRALGTLVVEPPRYIALECKAASVVLKQDKNDDDDEEDAYEQLRRAVKEYRVRMIEYYKAGHFFHEKAQEADKEACQKIFETKYVDTQDELILDLHEYGAKEAIPLLKLHISSLSGIASIKYLKVIIETDEKDTSKGARRRLIMKLLEKESIKWNEGGDAGTIVIRVDNIDRKA